MPLASFEKSSIVPNGVPRFAQNRARAQKYVALAAALILTASSAQRSAAQVTIHVDTTQQGITNGQCSLQEAIYASELKSSMAIDAVNPDNFYSTGCVAGTGKGDTILLPPGAVFTFNRSWDRDAHNAFGPTATPVIFSTITIEGNGATLQWVGPPAGRGSSRLFTIANVNDDLQNFPSGRGFLTLKNVHVKDFQIKGGDGGDNGGGGGLGAGGAIYVFDGSLIVQNSTFENNGAVGGNGAAGFSTSGGGGGLSGNGGAGCTTAGGGGGGSRGNGGKGGGIPACYTQNVSGGGGGGGGALSSGGDGTSTASGGSGGSEGLGAGGRRCGGKGGDAGKDGEQPTCRGAGGGGGGGVYFSYCGFFQSCSGDGAEGWYGGGGGGGVSNGGRGGFGGGGGAGFYGFFSVSGGDGGFGGGGGAAYTCNFFLCGWAHPGKGGRFGGHADGQHGGGGGALGGAIFNHRGSIQVENSTFVNNFVTRGVGGGGSASNGADAGGAIFSLGFGVGITHSTFSGNQSTGSGGAVVVYKPEDENSQLFLYNTIIANNGANECFFIGDVLHVGAGNLIMHNGSGTGQFSPCKGVVTKSDPQLLPLQLNSPGNTPTMAILPTSPAANKAYAREVLPTDQRGVARPPDAGDIGAFEARGDGT